MPTVLLELGFMDSSTDVPVILSEDYANKCAQAIVKVLVERGNLSRKKQPEPTADKSAFTVKEWQEAAIADGFSFPKYGADGFWGTECESVAKEAIVKYGDTYTNRNLTKLVQKAVGADVDGLCGKNTDNAIREYQRANGISAKVDADTWKKMLGIV
jgi:peptidoglycan hydrolase-like protein with peptidoglycan-binding domain